MLNFLAINPSIKSKNNAINPQQVVQLIEREVKLNDDGRIEVLDNNSNVRYNPKGELLTREDRVKEFLDTNPHFRNATNQGSGSKASIGGNTVKPFKIQDLDMSKSEDRKRYAEYRKERDSKPTQINLNNKHPHLNLNDIETITNIFFKKIIRGLDDSNNSNSYSLNLKLTLLPLILTS